MSAQIDHFRDSQNTALAFYLLDKLAKEASRALHTQMDHAKSDLEKQDTKSRAKSVISCQSKFCGLKIIHLMVNKICSHILFNSKQNIFLGFGCRKTPYSANFSGKTK